MKKMILAAAFLLATATAVLAQNDEISLGAKAGVNFSSLNGDNTDGLDGRTSFHLGAVVHIPITEKFAFQPELLYSAQGASRDGSFDGEEFFDSETTFRLDYITLPLLADYLVLDGLSIQAGPQIGININSEVEFNGETADLENTNTLDLSLAAGLQYVLNQGIFFQGRYTLGLSEISEDGDAKNGVLSISVGYRF